MGFDAHAFAPVGTERPLVLGGVRIDGAPGLAGWSDADVIAHAIGDALLGAANLGDLGAYFPKEAVAEGVSSLSLLREVARRIGEAGYAVANIDCVVIAQSVRVSPHRRAMAEALAGALGLEAGQVSVKATTTDRMGFTGRGEGIAATAVALLEWKRQWQRPELADGA
ncbi:MAG: 2-C-methyl-D-erythritol 2,4-cyclodiphosphate synthase [Actinomycetota bacterium]